MIKKREREKGKNREEKPLSRAQHTVRWLKRSKHELFALVISPGLTGRRQREEHKHEEKRKRV